MATAEQLRAAQELARARASGAVNYSQNLPSATSEPKPNSGMSSTYSTTGTGSSTTTKPPAYGSNILGFNPNTATAAQKQIAELGQQWWNNPENRTSIAAQAQEIGQAAGGTYDPVQGRWVFAGAPASGHPSNQYDPSQFSSADYINRQRLAAEEAARGQAWQASNTADAQALQNQQRLQELMASRGLGASGENITATAQGNAARQGALTDIQNQLQGNLSNIRTQADQALLDDLRRSQDIARQQQQQSFENSITEANLTGQYLPSGARSAIDNIQRLKQLAETPGISADQRTALSREADRYRSQLSSLGVNADLFGANVNAAQSGQNIGRAGIRTLAGQAQDYSQQADTRNFEFQQEQFSYQQARDKIADQRYKQEFDEDIRRFGLDYALNRQVQLGQLSQADARIALERQQLGNSQYNQGINNLLDVWRTSGVAPRGLESLGVQAGTPYTGQQQLPQNNAPDLNELGRYFDGVVQRDPDTGQISNPDVLENAILNSAVSDYDAYQLYNRYGLKWDGPVPSPN